MREQVLRFDLKSGYAALVCDDLIKLPLLDSDTAPVASRFRLLSLAKRLADALDNKEYQHRCPLHFADYQLGRGPAAKAPATHVAGLRFNWGNMRRSSHRH